MQYNSIALSSTMASQHGNLILTVSAAEVRVFDCDMDEGEGLRKAASSMQTLVFPEQVSAVAVLHMPYLGSSKVQNSKPVHTHAAGP